VDDSIVRFGSTGMQVLRRARGFAPLPIEIRNPRDRTILALGGHLKNTIALCLKTSRDGSDLQPENFSPTIVSSHLGDLDSTASIEAFRKSVEDLTSFYRIRPDAVACDLHPDYASTREAERLASQWNVPLVRVQHHHAHVAACMAERDLAGPLLGFAWDGTGYGLDNTIWGGESFLVNASKDACGELLEFTRFSHLRTFPLPGGDAAARQPRRSALGVLYEIFGEDAVNHVDGWFSSSEQKTLLQMLRRGTNCPRTSSMGRLFDAVAAMIGLTKSNENITYEGQAAMALEFLAATSSDKELKTAYPIPLTSSENGILLADWKPMVLALLADRAAGRSLPEMSGRFHRALAEMAVAIAQRANLSRIVLSGGCFQNSLLLRLTHRHLTAEGFQVFVPENIPPGDGGISLGQAFIAGFDPLERNAG
jgi:hydrogenase maturation protein HypF